MKQKNKVEPRKKIYSSKMIEELIGDINKGYEVDFSPFYEKDIELRAPNIVFKLTNEEYEEYKKCMCDANYFVENYCKFLNDNGRTLVKLRDFQKNILTTATTNHYEEDIDEFVPDNRNIVIMASRQTGKCLVDSEVVIKNNSNLSGYNKTNQKISNIYYKYKCKSLIFKIKRFLFKIYNKL